MLYMNKLQCDVEKIEKENEAEYTKDIQICTSPSPNMAEKWLNLYLVVC